MTSHINIYYVIGHVITQSVLEMGSFVSVVNSAALMQKYETGLYLLTAARALIVVLLPPPPYRGALSEYAALAMPRLAHISGRAA